MITSVSPLSYGSRPVSKKPAKAAPLRFQGELSTRVAGQRLLTQEELQHVVGEDMEDKCVGYVPTALTRETGLREELIQGYLNKLAQRLYSESPRQAVCNQDDAVEKSKPGSGPSLWNLWGRLWQNHRERATAYHQLDKMTYLRFLGSGHQGMVYHLRIGEQEYAFKVFRPNLMEDDPLYPYFEVAQAEFLTAHNVRDMPRHYISNPSEGWMLIEYMDLEKGKERRNGPRVESLGFEFVRPPRDDERFGNFRVDFGVYLNPVTPKGRSWSSNGKTLANTILDTKAEIAREKQAKEIITEDAVPS